MPRKSKGKKTIGFSWHYFFLKVCKSFPSGANSSFLTSKVDGSGFTLDHDWITIIELVNAVRNYLLNKQLSNVLKVKMYSVPHLTFFRQLVNSAIRQLRIWFSIRRKPQNCLPKTKKLRINHKVVYQKSLHFVAQTTFLFT